MDKIKTDIGYGIYECIKSDHYAFCQSRSYESDSISGFGRWTPCVPYMGADHKETTQSENRKCDQSCRYGTFNGAYGICVI